MPTYRDAADETVEIRWIHEDRVMLTTERRLHAALRSQLLADIDVDDFEAHSDQARIINQLVVRRATNQMYSHLESALGIEIYPDRTFQGV